MPQYTPSAAQQALQKTLQKLEKCIPSFRKKWMLWGTAVVAADIIRPRGKIPLVSIDLDFRSRAVMAPIHAEVSGIKKAFPKQEIEEYDLEFGILRTVVKEETTGLEVSIDLMTSDEETAKEKPELSPNFQGFPKQSLESYTRNKIACLTERLEEKDLLHLFFLAQTEPTHKRVIDQGLRKIPLKILLAHREALNKNWKSLTKKCVWGKLPDSATLNKLNQWLSVIQIQIEAKPHGKNRHQKPS